MCQQKKQEEDRSLKIILLSVNRSQIASIWDKDSLICFRNVGRRGVSEKQEEESKELPPQYFGVVLAPGTYLANINTRPERCAGADLVCK
jgi:hypothetical protein